jgi:hypothetical protein
MMICKARTRKGIKCLHPALEGKEYCGFHMLRGACAATMKSGPRKGQICGKGRKAGSLFCGIHNGYEIDEEKLAIVLADMFNLGRGSGIAETIAKY